MSIIFLSIPLSGCGKRDIQQWGAPPQMQIDTTKTYYAVFETSLGTFKVELWTKDAPHTVNNFIFLADQKFYDGTTFHRIRQNFMIQGGHPDPKDNTVSGPGYSFPDELPPNGNYDPGVLAMANAGADTNGSQFFICTGVNASDLNSNPNYTQFGKVIEGMEVVLKIAAVPVNYYSGEFGKPKNPPIVKHITIEKS